MDPRVPYYAAGVLWWSQEFGGSTFISDAPGRWKKDAGPLDDDFFYLGNRELLNLALDYLEQMEMLRIVRDRYGPAMCTIAPSALNELADRYDQSPFANTLRFRGRWITAALENVASEEQLADFSEGDWEPLKLDLQDASVVKNIEEIEEAIRRIAAENGFSVSYPETRDSLVNQATQAVESIKDGRATRGQVRSALVSAGRWIAEKFSGSAIGAVANEMVKAALRLLGLPI